MSKKIWISLIALILITSLTNVVATAPSVSVSTTGKQTNTFGFDLITNLDSNCLADWNAEKTTWEDFNGTKGVGQYYLTSSAGLYHGASVSAGEGYTARAIRYCCSETTYGQSDENATCGGYSYEFWYGSTAVSEVVIDNLVGIGAGSFEYVILLGLGVLLTILAVIVFPAMAYFKFRR